MSENANHYRAVIIGTGFGGTMTAIPLAQHLKVQHPGETVLMLERGTWWTTPVSTVQDKEVKTAEFIANKGQPVQYWSSLNNFRGFLDIFSRCFRRTAWRRRRTSAPAQPDWTPRSCRFPARSHHRCR